LLRVLEQLGSGLGDDLEAGTGRLHGVTDDEAGGGVAVL